MPAGTRPRHPEEPRGGLYPLALIAAALLVGSTSCRALLDLDDPAEGPGAAPPSGADCDQAIAVSLSVERAPVTQKGSTVGGGSSTSVGGGSCNGAKGPERVYAVTSEEDGFLTARLASAGTSFNTVIYAATLCSQGDLDNPINCADRTAPAGSAIDGGEVMSFPVSAGGLTYIGVDGAAPDDAGEYELILSLNTGDTCASAIPIVLEPGTPMTLVGDSSKAADDDACYTPNAGGDLVYAITGAAGRSLAIGAEPTGFDVALFVRPVCDDDATTYTCEDFGGLGTTESSLVPTGIVDKYKPFYVWVDGGIHVAGDGPPGGPFLLTLSPGAP